jgi:hypothetical protein
MTERAGILMFDLMRVATHGSTLLGCRVRWLARHAASARCRIRDAKSYADTVAVVISDHGPFSPCVLTQRAM